MSNEPISEPPAAAVAATDEPVAQAWDKNVDKPGNFPLILAGIFVLLTAGAVTLAILSHEYADDFKQIDKYNPEWIALKQRYFVDWRAFENSLCLDSIYKLNNETYPGPQYVGDMMGVDTTANGTDSMVGDTNETDSHVTMTHHEVVCEYQVPVTAVWGAMAAALFGLAAVCVYAWDVLNRPRGTDLMSETAATIHEAALQFLKQEYQALIPFVVLLFVFILVAIDGQENDWVPAASVSFLMGSILSASCGFMGMHLATQGNCRTAAACYSSQEEGLSRGLQVAFRTGACMGLGVVSFGALGLSASYMIFRNTTAMAGFGFGASAVALFARVGGGIYTKAADVGADLCGKVDKDLGEDSPKNPATIADCVGDNVGDVAGMGADLFESYVGSVVAACVLGASEFGEKGVALPFYLVLIGLGISVFCTTFIRVGKKADGSSPGLNDLLAAMRVNVVIAGILIVGASAVLCILLFKDERDALSESGAPFEQREPGVRLFGSIVVGLICGILIGSATEYFTSHTDRPTQTIGEATEYGPGPVVIQGLGMGMYSTVIPLGMIAVAVMGAYYLAGFYGTAIACVGMLSTLGVTMSTDAYGPVSDNAGGIAEMSELPSWVRDNTDALDALGNTTAATGKGFANGSAVLAAVAILTAFARVAGVEEVNLLKPVVVIGILVGSLLPYVFGAMTMLSVNKAAQEMMSEVRRQFKENPAILTDPNVRPDYKRCIAISANSSLKEMILPGVLAIFTPLVLGFTFGSHCLVGLLIGSIASGYLLAVMMSNTGGAWDNAKKWIEAGGLELNGVVQKKGSDCHKAAVCGDTVGDPFKDTSGPALNILLKLMAQFAFVLAPLFAPDYEYWYVGISILGGAIVLVAILKLTVLKDHPHHIQEQAVAVADRVSAADSHAHPRHARQRKTVPRILSRGYG